jgi:hypothetical protein
MGGSIFLVEKCIATPDKMEKTHADIFFEFDGDLMGSNGIQ